MPLSLNEEALLTYRTLLSTARRLRRSVNAILKDYALTGAQFALLSAIPEDGIPLTRLASLSWADPGNVSGIADRLEDAGWVERKRSSEDRRVVLICLSEEGRDIVRKLSPKHQTAVAEAFQDLDSMEMKQIRASLSKIKIEDGR